jgi:alanine racemase
LPIGYNEGYIRLLSNKGNVLIGGKRCPVIGRVCMNLTIVDVTSVDGVKVGDEVVIIGKQGKQEITADQIAVETKTINYEVVTRINPLIPRIII